MPPHRWKSAINKVRVNNSIKYTRQLIQLIEACNIEEIQPFIATYHSLINWHYKDDSGDTLLHLASRTVYYKDARIKMMVCQPIYEKIGIWAIFTRNKYGKLPQDLLQNPDVFCRAVGIAFLPKEKEVVGAQMRQKIMANLNAILYSDTKRVYPGIYMVDDLTLFMNAQSANQLTIPNKWEKMDINDRCCFTLHERLQISCVAAKAVNNLAREPWMLQPGRNCLTANMWFIVTTLSNGKQDFITLPIIDYQHPVRSLAKGVFPGHSEDALYSYLGTGQAARYLLEALLEELRSPEAQSIKLEGVVLDIFSELDMCNRCQHATFHQQEQLLDVNYMQTLENVALSMQFRLPDQIKTVPEIGVPAKYCLKSVVRISCLARYAYSDTTVPRCELNHPFPKISEFRLDDISRYQPTLSDGGFALTHIHRDLNNFQNSVIFHKPPTDRLPDSLSFLPREPNRWPCNNTVTRSTLFMSNNQDYTRETVSTSRQPCYEF